MVSSKRKKLKISVIMVDGSFRENTFGTEYFAKQSFPKDQYEISWIEFYNTPNKNVLKQTDIRVITLNKTGVYHSSYCFNRGINEAKGEVLVIPDADQIVPSDFLEHVWKKHQEYDKLVVYGYRYDERHERALASFDFDELEQKCVLKNPINYGGCLTIRKQWLLEINGYEQHPIFGTGFHANGLDIYTRFKNYGLSITWDPDLKIYHPWHPYTLIGAGQYTTQKKIIDWRALNQQWSAFQGIDPEKNICPPDDAQGILDEGVKTMVKEIETEESLRLQNIKNPELNKFVETGNKQKFPILIKDKALKIFKKRNWKYSA